ncbi:hypothetical protein ACOL22_01810 [Aliarcobacter butzleri]
MKCFIGTVAIIAMYNLLEDEFETHTLADGKTAYIVEANDEKIEIWKNANENNLIEVDINEIVSNSMQLNFTKKRILEFIDKKTSEFIYSIYPIHKQNNINELQRYTQEDKEEMWAFINNERERVENLELSIKNASTLKELKTIEEGL